MKKWIEENIQDLPKNGFLIVEGKQTGISNLEKYCENNKEIANQNDIYDYIENEIPEYDPETQYIQSSYELINNVIHKTYTVLDIPEEITEGMGE